MTDTARAQSIQAPDESVLHQPAQQHDAGPVLTFPAPTWQNFTRSR